MDYPDDSTEATQLTVLTAEHSNASSQTPMDAIWASINAAVLSSEACTARITSKQVQVRGPLVVGPVVVSPDRGQENYLASISASNDPPLHLLHEDEDEDEDEIPPLVVRITLLLRYHNSLPLFHI